MNYSNFDKLSIYELRNYARNVGVYNPTVLKKRDLIDAIINIETGKVPPHISKTKQGRPPKNIGQLVSVFMADDIENVPTYLEKMYEQKPVEQVLCQNVDKTEECEEIVFHGYLEILSDGNGLLRQRISLNETHKERCFIRLTDVNKFQLKHGDEIVCNAYKVSDERPWVCETIISINSIALENLSDRVNYLTENNLCKKEKIDTQDSELNNLGLYYGDTIFVYNNSITNFINFAVKFAKDNKNNFDKYVYLSPTSLQEEYGLVGRFPDELYLSSFNESFSCQQRTTFMAHNRAMRLAELGQNVCLIVQDILGLVSMDSSNSGELAISKSILSSAKTLNKGSLTIICGYNDIKFPYLKNKINSVFPILESCGLFLENYGINYKDSYRKK